LFYYPCLPQAGTSDENLVSPFFPPVCGRQALEKGDINPSLWQREVGMDFIEFTFNVIPLENFKIPKSHISPHLKLEFRF
jgi:hypothetical protein